MKFETSKKLARLEFWELLDFETSGGAMRRLLVLMMICPVVALGQTRVSASAFPLTVHVVSSRIGMVPGDQRSNVSGVNFLDLLRVQIAGRKYVLAVPLRRGIFARMEPVLMEPGDYPARVTLDKTPNPGELRRTYELRLANGKTVKAYLWGISE
jgi:hypothetical protein